VGPPDEEREKAPLDPKELKKKKKKDFNPIDVKARPISKSSYIKCPSEKGTKGHQVS
jgi:hypothetical protein